jgi:hypothetical protein
MTTAMQLTEAFEQTETETEIEIELCTEEDAVRRVLESVRAPDVSVDRETSKVFFEMVDEFQGFAAMCGLRPSQAEVIVAIGRAYDEHVAARAAG